MKTTLSPKQEKLLNQDEKQILNLFFNINSSKEKKETPDFITKLVSIKKSEKDLYLYQKLTKIYNYLGEKYARKYLIGYLEYKNSNSLHEYLISLN